MLYCFGFLHRVREEGVIQTQTAGNGQDLFTGRSEKRREGLNISPIASFPVVPTLVLKVLPPAGFAIDDVSLPVDLFRVIHPPPAGCPRQDTGPLAPGDRVRDR